MLGMPVELRGKKSQKKVGGGGARKETEGIEGVGERGAEELIYVTGLKPKRTCDTNAQGRDRCRKER